MGDLGGMYAALMGQVGNDYARTTQVGMQVGDRMQDSNSQLIRAIRENRARMDALKQQDTQNAFKERAMSLEETLGQGKMGLMGAQTANIGSETAARDAKLPGELKIQDLNSTLLEAQGRRAGTEADISEATKGAEIASGLLKPKQAEANIGLTTQQIDTQKAAAAHSREATQWIAPQARASIAASGASAENQRVHAAIGRQQLEMGNDPSHPGNWRARAAAIKEVDSNWQREAAIVMSMGGMPPPRPTDDDYATGILRQSGRNAIVVGGEAYEPTGVDPQSGVRVYKRGGTSDWGDNGEPQKFLYITKDGAKVIKDGNTEARKVQASSNNMPYTDWSGSDSAPGNSLAPGNVQNGATMKRVGAAIRGAATTPPPSVGVTDLLGLGAAKRVGTTTGANVRTDLQSLLAGLRGE